MGKIFKNLFALIVLPLLVLLTGCNSEGAFSSQLPIDAAGVEITVFPSPILVLEGHTQHMVAVAKYDNGAERDVSDSVTWEIVGDPTIADISASGLLTGNVKGDTGLIASKDGITSNTVNVTVCDLAGPCIDIFDTGSGKLFTSSPSEAYLDSIGGSATNSTSTESDSSGPDGVFYRFDWNNANALCDTYNTHSLGGRTNWSLATQDELKVELYNTYNNMFTARGWASIYYYWSVTADGSGYYVVDLYNGDVYSILPNYMGYASCVSTPGLVAKIVGSENFDI